MAKKASLISRVAQSIYKPLQEFLQGRKVVKSERLEPPTLSILSGELADIESVTCQLDRNFKPGSLDMQLSYLVKLTNYPDTTDGTPNGDSICDFLITLRRGRKNSGEWFKGYTLGDIDITVRYAPEDLFCRGFYMGMFTLSGLTWTHRELGRNEEGSPATMAIRVPWTTKPTDDQVGFKRRVIDMIRFRKVPGTDETYLDNSTRLFFESHPEFTGKEPINK